MENLSLHLLGPFQALLDGKPITGFKSSKTRALLAYLAVEAGKPHHRDSLAGLLWPEWSERDALRNLRSALSDLRRGLGDKTAATPFLLVTRDSIQFNIHCEHCLDVREFIKGAEVDKTHPNFLDELEKAVALYKGNFLEGFSLDGSPTFEEWMLLTRERLARQMSSFLHFLAEYFEENGDYEKAKSYSYRQLELDSWDESAHRIIMRALALSGQRNAALSQYETCRELLASELGVEPTDETTCLYEQIREGTLKEIKKLPSIQSQTVISTPAFLAQDNPDVEISVFVARTGELAKLNEHLHTVLSGKGRVVFITGEAGSGKTTLIQEFVRCAQEMQPSLLVATGNCNAYTGIGDPYLPFREILEFLTGDVESRWAAGAIKREHVMRLWNKLPAVAQALVDAGPDLIDTFVQRAGLFDRVRGCVSQNNELLLRLDTFLDQKPMAVLSMAALHQVNLFEQYTKVLQSLETGNPLLLVIDDLQWADTGTINLLFHLGRCISEDRILLIGSYRSEEVALGRGSGRHPLEPVINELRRNYGDILVNLGQALGQEESREFVEALLDSEPNRLDKAFREMLYQQTQGHPLFTIELLRGLQDRGDILKDPEGYWIAGHSLDWETLPVRVEAAIQERINRLPEEMQRALEVASVEGEQFTAEVLARLRGMDEREMLEHLSGDLDRKHHLVRAQSIQRFNDRLLSRYQFRHILFQKYLYGRLDEVVRVHLHEQVGTILEELYGAGVAGIEIPAVQLALHFERAQIDSKAMDYLFLAVQKSMQLSGYQEVVTHATHALSLLEKSPDSPERDQQELDLHLSMGLALAGAKGGQIPEVRDAYMRARQLCEKLGKESNKLVQVLCGLAIYYYVRAEYHKARDHAQEALDLAKTTQDSLLIMLCDWCLGFILFGLGEFEQAMSHLRQVIECYDHKNHHQVLVQLRGADAGLSAMAYETCCLWFLGYPDQAKKLSQTSLAMARKLTHPFTMTDVICYAGCLFHSIRRDAVGLALESDALIEISSKFNLAGWIVTAIRFHGESLLLQGKLIESSAQIKESIAKLQSEGIGLNMSGTLANQAEVQLQAGMLEDAQSSLDEAFAFVEKTNERYYEAELFRLKGELLFLDRDVAGAEACLNKAIDITRKQNAKSLELRSALSLSRMWEKQGKKAQAKKLLADVYNWFSEGFDTPDLLEAKTLLDDLS